MKKLIINQNNLPKIIKSQQSSLRMKINNKTINSISPLITKKSPNSQINDTNEFIQILDNHINKEQYVLQKDHLSRIIQLLKNYRDLLNNNSIQNMSQSFKINKIKLKFGQEEKQNTPSPKNDRNSLNDKKKLFDFKKSSIIIPVTSNNKRQKSAQIQNNSTQFNQYSDQKFQNKSFEQYQMKAPKRSSNTSEKIQIDPNQFKKKLAGKQQEINQLKQRIQQLNSNIKSLITKDSQKSQQLTKLRQQNIELLQKYNKHKKQVKNMSKKSKQIQRQKNQQIQQLKQRHKTAQTFYQLTRTDLIQQNDRLLQRIKQIQKQLIHVYQISHSIQEQMYKQLIQC